MSSSSLPPNPRGRRTGADPVVAADPAVGLVTHDGILRELGIVGLDDLEPVIIAAIATESPLLLIGAHGTAKSLLLTRLCGALGLSWRHYNASLLNYDDLVGYPLPDADGRLQFIQTPASIWGAQAVFLDEISRCRPDMQNRLFPIIHERRVQGLPLTDLRFRWAAMNPPADPEAEGADYLGSEPLDAALADRFPFIVTVPSFATMTKADQQAIITGSHGPIPPHVASRLTALIQDVQHRLVSTEQVWGSALADYVRVFVAQARTAGMILSGRRATMIYRNLIAVHAASGLAAVTDPGPAVYRTICTSLPQLATGHAMIAPAKLRVLHREVWTVANLSAVDPRRALIAETNPINRALLAISLKADRPTTSAYIADALASSAPGARHALALHLSQTTGLVVIPAVAEQIATLVGSVLEAQEVADTIPRSGPRFDASKAITSYLTQPASEAAVGNLLLSLWKDREIMGRDDVTTIIQSWRQTRTLLGRLDAKHRGGE